MDTLGIKKRELEAFDERVRVLTTAVHDGEVRMDMLSAKDRHLIALTTKVDALSKRFETLFAESDDLTKKQLALETLNERLGQVDELAKNTSWQMDSLKQSRADLEVLRKDVQEFYKSHAEIAQLRDKLGSDRLALEAFGDRMTALSTARRSSMRMDASGKMTLVDEGRVAHAAETVADLRADPRVSARVPFVARSKAPRRPQSAQRRRGRGRPGAAAPRPTRQGVMRRPRRQMVDAQHKLESVRQLQQRLRAARHGTEHAGRRRHRTRADQA